MERNDLAKQLVGAKTEAERKRLLKGNLDLADERLAFDLRELCRTAWSTSPTDAQRAAKSLKTLVRFNQRSEIKALAEWAAGVSAITTGEFDQSIASLSAAARIFTGIGLVSDAAEAEVAKMIPLALIGKSGEAVRIGKNSLKILEKCGNEFAAGTVEMNLSNIASRREHDREAEKYCLSALRRFTSIGDKKSMTMAQNDLANTYAQLNDFRKAEDYYALALKSAKKAGLAVTEAEIEASMGNLATFRGKFDSALRFLEQSRQKYQLLNMPHQTAIAELEIADIYLELNLADEAVAIYERVTAKLQTLKMPAEEARARANYGKACAILRETARARVELERSAELYLSEKNKAGAALVKISEAVIEIGDGDSRKALRLVKNALRLLGRDSNVRHRLTADWLAGEALLNLGKLDEAERILADTYSRSNELEQKNIARTSLNSLGNIALQKGDVATAKKHFETAVDVVETLRAPLPAEEFRMAFLADKLAPYENLARIHIQEEDWQSAFYYVEQARSRALAESLDGRAELNGKKVPVRLVRELESLREELNWYYSRLNRNSDGETAKLNAKAVELESKISDTMRRIESTGALTDFSQNSVRNARSGGLELLQSSLGPGKVLIEFVTFDGVISAFAVSDNGIAYVSGLARESEIIDLLEGLQFQFGALRYGAAALLRHEPELKRRADFYLERLYEKLLKPLEGHFGQRDIVVVPFGVLHYVPFHALKSGERYVIELREVVHAPGAEVWRKLMRMPVRKPKNALLFGFADETIPLVYKEIKALRNTLPRSVSYIGKRASFRAYQENAPNFDILHIACHGRFRPENPLFSSLHLADGNITVRDICRQSLKAQLVTLSACETGLSRIFAGDEILGLARGFLVAGAHSLLLSQWTVNDQATTELMKEFYAQINRGRSAAGALREAQCNFAARGAHPYYWASFVIIGK